MVRKKRISMLTFSVVGVFCFLSILNPTSTQFNNVYAKDAPIKDKTISDSGTFRIRRSDETNDSFYDSDVTYDKWYNTTVTWSLENGTLTISGNGDMNESAEIGYPSVSNNVQTESNWYPWSKYYYITDKIVIEDGITSIGYAAFAYFVNLETVELPDSLKMIREYAFCNYPSFDSKFREITIPQGTKLVGNRLFPDEPEENFFTLKGYKGSNAENYAIEQGYNFVAVDEEPTVTSTKLGDINLDGKVGIDDAVILNKYLVDSAVLTEQGKLNADCDKDGSITAADSLRLLEYLVGSISEL